MHTQALPDPRYFLQHSAGNQSVFITALYQAVDQYLHAPTHHEKERHAATILDQLSQYALDTSVTLLSFDEIIALAPSVESARVLERLIYSWEKIKPQEGELRLQFFAFPVILIVAAEQPAAIPAILSNKHDIEAILDKHHILGEAKQWAISNALCTAEALAGQEWLRWMKQQQEALSQINALQHLLPSELSLTHARQEQVFLRFIVGSAIISSKTNWESQTTIKEWGMALSNSLNQQLGLPNITLLALARPPHTLSGAVQEGRKAQREIGLQLFVTEAVRSCRTTHGEPVIVLSSHTLGQKEGEIRISISSPFSTKDAQGFRFPLFPTERIQDAQRLILELLEECRLTDIRILQKIYPDKESQTSLTLLFKPETIPDDELIF
jgi:hypothetical protein